MKSTYQRLTSLSIFLMMSTTSCGWHISENLASSQKHTISIPYVEGDSDGTLTSQLAQSLEKQGSFKYLPTGAELTLKVKLLDSESQNIGLRDDPKKLANGKRRMIPNETRRRLLAQVTVVNALTEQILLGPAYIVGSCDFDHQYYSLSHNINNFSLGQLTDIDTTYDVVDIPLHRNLASNIALYLENNTDKLLASRV